MIAMIEESPLISLAEAITYIVGSFFLSYLEYIMALEHGIIWLTNVPHILVYQPLSRLWIWSLSSWHFIVATIFERQYKLYHHHARNFLDRIEVCTL